jgi:hypothetical protein
MNQRPLLQTVEDDKFPEPITRGPVMTQTPKYVYVFGASKTEGDASMKNLLGGKGANLAEMCRL